MTQALAADLPAGEHTVTYRVVSTDGHPVSGTVTFTTTAAPASASPSATATATPTPSPTVAAVASPEPTVTADPALGELRWRRRPLAGRGGRRAAGRPRRSGAAWRTIGGPTRSRRRARMPRDDAPTSDQHPARA